MPGTHGKVLAHANSNDADNMLGRREFVVDDVDSSRAVDLELEPGQMSLHHALVVHGSEPNRSGRRRLGFAIRYLPGTVRQTDGRRNFATLVQGADHGTFDLEQAPEGDFHPDALARHREVLRRGMAVIYDGKPAGGGPSP
jgi:non-heme Fe2+,alpha-ketoglutarate-dependent halogenase